MSKCDHLIISAFVEPIYTRATFSVVCWQILFADGTVSNCGEHILHSAQDPFTRENGCLREQHMDGRESKERKGIAITAEQNGTGSSQYLLPVRLHQVCFGRCLVNRNIVLINAK